MLLKTSPLTFLLCLFLGIHAHSQKMDSLKNELLHQKGEERFAALYELVFEYLDKEDYPKALKYIEEAQRVAAQYDDSLHIVKAGRVKGQTLRRLDRTTDAINEFQRVLPVSKRNGFVDEYDDILNGMAVAYIVQANYDKALLVLFECLLLREKRGDQTEINTTLINIGVVYYTLDNFEKALEYYDRILVNGGQIESKDRLLINIGLCHNELRNFSAAKTFIEEGMKICAPNCSDHTIIQAEYGFGVSLFYLNKPEEAEGHFLVSYDLALKGKDKRSQIENLIFLGKINNLLGRFEDSKIVLGKAESVAAGTEYNELLIDIYKQFSELYMRTKAYKNAAIYERKYMVLRDSIYSRQLIKNLMKIQADYEQRENTAKIESQEQILTLKEEVIVKQRFLNFLASTVAVLFVMLALIFFKLSSQRKSMNVLLDRKVGERTIALEKSLDDLRRSHDEQEIILRTISSDMKASVATIRGLCALSSGLEDIPVANIKYVKEFEETAGRIAEIVNRVQRITKS